MEQCQGFTKYALYNICKKKKIKIWGTNIIIWTLTYSLEGQKSGGNFGRASADFLPGKEFPAARRVAFGFSSTWPPSCFNTGLLSADKGRGNVQSRGGRQLSISSSQQRSCRGARGSAWVCREALRRGPTQDPHPNRAPLSLSFFQVDEEV